MSNYGWLRVDTDLMTTDNFVVSLLYNFIPNGDRMYIGGYVYILGTSVFFQPYSGEDELAPTYEPIINFFNEWESFNKLNYEI